MALKRKIDKAAFDALADVLKTEYKEKDGAYYLDTDDATALEASLEAQRRETAALKESLAALQATADEAKRKEDEAQAEKNRKTKDYDALENDYKTKLETAKAEAKAREDKLNAKLNETLVDARAMEVATAVFGDNAEIMLPHVKARLRGETDGEKAITRVLDKDGNASASTLADLQKEFVDNPKYASIVVHSRASGGDARGTPPLTGKASEKAPADMNDVERRALLETNPTAFYAAFPHAAPQAA